MFTGLVILIMIAFFGYSHSTTLPQPITQFVLVYMDNLASDARSVCRGDLYPAGLRGAILGWSDGIFAAFKTVYYGPSEFATI
jgi:hypothetical protein